MCKKHDLWPYFRRKIQILLSIISKFSKLKTQIKISDQLLKQFKIIEFSAPNLMTDLINIISLDENKYELFIIKSCYVE